MSNNFELIEHLGVLYEYPTKWKKEINLISWGKTSVQLDIRDWSSDHKHWSRGIGLSMDEAEKLRKILLTKNFE